jgi:hypothetical protein
LDVIRQIEWIFKVVWLDNTNSIRDFTTLLKALSSIAKVKHFAMQLFLSATERKHQYQNRTSAFSAYLGQICF